MQGFSEPRMGKSTLRISKRWAGEDCFSNTSVQGVLIGVSGYRFLTALPAQMGAAPPKTTVLGFYEDQMRRLTVDHAIWDELLNFSHTTRLGVADPASAPSLTH